MIRFINGEKHEVPIVYGRDVRDWWTHENEPEETEHSVIAWQGTSPYSASQNADIRLFKSTWKNPRPSVEIKSIDCISSEVESAPFLVAITAE